MHPKGGGDISLVPSMDMLQEFPAIQLLKYHEVSTLCLEEVHHVQYVGCAARVRRSLSMVVVSENLMLMQKMQGRRRIRKDAIR